MERARGRFNVIRSDSDGGRTVQLRNPHLKSMKVDNLYYLGLSTGTHNLKEMFGDIKSPNFWGARSQFVCMGGTSTRMYRFAQFIKAGLDIKLPTGADLCDITSQASQHYSMYKIGPVLSVSHGMGSPSLSIVMHELLKLLHYSHCTADVVLMRLGTCGGIGIPPGSVVVSTGVVNGLLREELEVFILGERVSRPCRLDADLAREISDVGSRLLPALQLVRGRTLSTDDFYEGQGRLDGAVCEYTEEAKRKFMEKIRAMGICNIEMEASQFAAMCHHAGIKGSVVCATIVDRMKGDQVTASAADMAKWQNQIQELALQFMRNRLGLPPVANK